MNVVLLISLIVLMFISFFINKRKLFSPSFMLLGGFCLCAIVLIAEQKNWHYYISFKTVLVIFISSLLFIFGEYAGKKMFVSRGLNSFNRSNDMIYGTFSPRKHPLFVFAVILFSLSVLVLQIRYFLKIVSLSGFSATFFNMFSYGGDVRTYVVHNEIDRNFAETFYVKSLLPVSFVFFFAFVSNIYNGVRDRVNIFFLIPMVCHLFSELLSSNRIGILYILIYALCTIVLAYLDKTRWNSKSNKKVLLFLFVSCVFVLIMFRISGFATQRGQNVSFFDQISIYTGASIVALDQGITGNAPIITNAETLFSGVLKLFNSLGITNFEFMASNAEFVKWGDASTNIFTAIYAYICAFGLIGNFIVFLLLGFLFGRLSRYREESKKSTVSIIYSWLLFVPLLSCIADRFFTQVLISFFFIQIIEIMVFNQIIFNYLKSDSPRFCTKIVL